MLPKAELFLPGRRIGRLLSRCAIASPAIALWGARHPDQLDPVTEVMSWKLDRIALMEIDRIPSSIASAILSDRSSWRLQHVSPRKAVLDRSEERRVGKEGRS